MKIKHNQKAFIPFGKRSEMVGVALPPEISSSETKWHLIT